MRLEIFFFVYADSMLMLFGVKIEVKLIIRFVCSNKNEVPELVPGTWMQWVLFCFLFFCFLPLSPDLKKYRVKIWWDD